MPTLFICHDTGNTAVLIKAAQELQERKPAETLIFLIAGAAAKKKLEANPVPGARIEYLAKWIDATDEEAIQRRALSSEELDKVKLKLTELSPSRAITGCSCWKEAVAPLQLAKLLAESLSSANNFVYNGEFLFDTENNPFWGELDKLSNLGLLVALPEARAAALERNSALKVDDVKVVGHPVLDDMLSATELSFNEAIKDELEMSRAEKLLFISGSKFIEEDLPLLEALAGSIPAGTSAYIGLHPGTDKLDDYVGKILDWLATHRDCPIKLVIGDALAARITRAELLADERVVRKNLSGDQLFSAADGGVASSVASTLVTQALVQGRPVYCTKSAESYLHRLFPLRENWGKEQEKLTRDKLGLTEPALELLLRNLS